jgi:hypothetical protein
LIVALGHDRAKSGMKDLACIELVQDARPVGYHPWEGCARQFCRDMVGGFIGTETIQCENVDLTQESCIAGRECPQGFEVTGAGSFQMHQAFGLAPGKC